MSQPTDAYIEWKQWDDSSFGKFTSLDALYFAAETSIGSQQPSMVLEIGFGNGGFLAWAQGVGAEIVGVEINGHLNARAREFFATGIFVDRLEDPALDGLLGRFTHIVAFDVIEHIPAEDLPAVLRRIRDLLATDGRFIARFPNGDSPFGRINQHGDPTHVNTIGGDKLAYFARSAGLRVLEMRAPALPVSGFGFSRTMRRRAIGLGRFVVERIVAALYFGGRLVPLDPNYVAVLARTN
jgi:SAM-dependent methyltransferase